MLSSLRDTGSEKPCGCLNVELQNAPANDIAIPANLHPVRTHGRTDRDMDAQPARPRTLKCIVACACNANSHGNDNASGRRGWADEEMEGSPEIRSNASQA